MFNFAEKLSHVFRKSFQSKDEVMKIHFDLVEALSDWEDLVPSYMMRIAHFSLVHIVIDGICKMGPLIGKQMPLRSRHHHDIYYCGVRSSMGILL